MLFHLCVNNKIQPAVMGGGSVLKKSGISSSYTMSAGFTRAAGHAALLSNKYFD
jgi:hypothetical protein